MCSLVGTKEGRNEERKEEGKESGSRMNVRKEETVNTKREERRKE